ncbi:hypothetical protein EcWSU1_03784 [Enterobacter ludwigii]|uniref:Uncharacterized protein n=1 Tax=Enterobacter ludwigii TaxID=299767 RepID=G8LE18_9ENTR|nr:hypothetical protein EcWSU1_03784 [Enterobacter ludwigii]
MSRYYWHYADVFLRSDDEKNGLNRQQSQRICYEIDENSADYQHPDLFHFWYGDR